MLAEKTGGEITEYFLPRDFGQFCTGCTKCFMDNETLCPHYKALQPITEALDTSDIIILASPVYVYHATGAMKSFLDHYGYRWMVHSPEPVRKWLGITLLPQAGVALGMCATAYRVLGGAEGTLIRNIILFSVLVYELIGPSLTKMALTKAGDIKEIPAEVKGRRKKRLEEVTKPVPPAFDK